jgi:hypothetical protein
MYSIQPISPQPLNAAQRAYEITLILAAAIIRCNSANKATETHSSLGFLPGKSVHTTSYPQERLS